MTTKTNPSYLSFNQLKPYCTRLYNLLIDAGSSSQREKIRSEQQLWAEVKLLRSFKDQNLLNYLIGYYHSLLYHIVKEPSTDGSFSVWHDEFHYNILIRLGDLNRYRQCDRVAEYYYSNARNLFPLFGHAYNQLALILAKPEVLPANYYKCCYYYARAAKSSDNSLASLAESNLRIAANIHDSGILFRLLNGDAGSSANGCVDTIDDCNSSDLRNSEELSDGLPTSAIDWFYLMVVAIYADNIQLIARSFLDFMRENFSTQRATLVAPGNFRQTSIYCDKDAYLLLSSLDIFLDWLRLGSQGPKLISTIDAELRKIRNCLQSTLASVKYESSIQRNDSRGPGSKSPSPKTITLRTFGISDTTNSSCESKTDSQNRSNSHIDVSHSSGCSTKACQIALPHDYTMRGFEPLDEVHRAVSFCNFKKLVSLVNHKVFNQIECTDEHGQDDSSNECFISSDQLSHILNRILGKMDGFGGLLKKKSRNIALESILANMNNA